METFIADVPRLSGREASLVAVLRQAYEYLDMIPESAAGGDDAAVNLARKIRVVLSTIGE